MEKVKGAPDRKLGHKLLYELGGEEEKKGGKEGGKKKRLIIAMDNDVMFFP